MSKNYVVILYEIINFDKKRGIYIYKPTKYLDNCDVNMKNDIATSLEGKKYFSMYDSSVQSAKERVCYGFPLLFEDLKKIYKSEGLSDKELLDRYYTSLDSDVIFGVYDPIDDEMKCVLAEKDRIINQNSDTWIYDFFYEEKEPEEFDLNNEEILEFEDEPQVFMSLDTVKQIEIALESNKVQRAKDFFNAVIRSSEQLPGQTLKAEMQEQKEAKTIDEKLNSVKDSLDKLNNLVGLENVKNEVNDLVNFLTYLNKVKDVTEINKPNLHMFFTGNPGTGKTTVARIIADILYQLGYTENKKFKEITTKDLIGGYVGQTAIKTGKVLKEAKGGVVFIDEAYSFASEAQEFGDEALVEIIKEMEKNETIFIFAGYKDEMEKFMNKNPGLASRTGYYIDYRDYKDEELLQMFINKINSSKLKLNEDAYINVLEIINEAKRNKHFGNGRFIDKLFNKVIIKHATNTIDSNDKEKLITITKEDFPDSIKKRINI